MALGRRDPFGIVLGLCATVDSLTPFGWSLPVESRVQVKPRGPYALGVTVMPKEPRHVVRENWGCSTSSGTGV